MDGLDHDFPYEEDEDDVTEFALHTEDGRDIPGEVMSAWQVPRYEGYPPQSVSVNGLRGILHRNNVAKICVTITDPIYIVLQFTEWPDEVFCCGEGVWGYIVSRSGARKTTKVTTNWKREGF